MPEQQAPSIVLARDLWTEQAVTFWTENNAEAPGCVTLVVSPSDSLTVRVALTPERARNLARMLEQATDDA